MAATASWASSPQALTRTLARKQIPSASYLEKPITPEDLLDQIEKLLGGPM